MGYALLAASIVVVALGLMLSSVEGKVKRLDRRLARMEREQDRLLDHFGLNEFTPDLGEVEELLRRDEKLQAIKRYRELTGSDLREATAAVDRLQGSR